MDLCIWINFLPMEISRENLERIPDEWLATIVKIISEGVKKQKGIPLNDS